MLPFVIPAKAGIQGFGASVYLDPGQSMAGMTALKKCLLKP